MGAEGIREATRLPSHQRVFSARAVGLVGAGLLALGALTGCGSEDASVEMSAVQHSPEREVVSESPSPEPEVSDLPSILHHPHATEAMLEPVDEAMNALEFYTVELELAEVHGGQGARHVVDVNRADAQQPLIRSQVFARDAQVPSTIMVDLADFWAYCDVRQPGDGQPEPFADCVRNDYAEGDEQHFYLHQFVEVEGSFIAHTGTGSGGGVMTVNEQTELDGAPVTHYRVEDRQRSDEGVERVVGASEIFVDANDRIRVLEVYSETDEGAGLQLSHRTTFTNFNQPVQFGVPMDFTLN